MRIELLYARFAQPFVHAPGLFSTFRKGERKKRKLDITYTYKDSSFRFLGPEPLDAIDLLVLQGLVAHATACLRNAVTLLHDGRGQSRKLELTGSADGTPTIAIRFNLTDFCRNLGYAKSGTALLQVKNSIIRLSAVTVIAKHNGKEGSFRLLAYSIDNDTGEMLVGLNPTTTASVLGKSSFLSLAWNEIRQLKSNVARLLHMRLSWINVGTIRQVRIETLCEYAFPSEPDLAPNGTLRRRKLVVRGSLFELAHAGWSVKEDRPGLYSIGRPHREVTRTRPGRYREHKGEI